ncbi:MAG TPA: GNAT family N-acetyltransferase [Solirubrobacteraceae bacterium]|jgi:GNAT superfamily N-acetyltransferase|nr:GNAT family N-acetyltransferase [Solirubrobacteraceae bacterium]
MQTRAVDAERVRPLRMRVLRPGRPPHDSVYDGDEEPGTLHCAVVTDAGELVGIATALASPHPRDPAIGDWRIRGMATAPERRREGVGRMLLAACEQHVREAAGLRIWCNARVAAVPFYESAGYATESEIFEIPTIGPHRLMAKPVASSL